MAHYTIEIKGAAPIDWEMLRQQRNDLVGILLGTDDRPPRRGLSTAEARAIDGIANLLDAILNTHDGIA